MLFRSSSAPEQIVAFGSKNQVLIELLKDPRYGPLYAAKKAMTEQYSSDDLAPEDFAKKHGRQAGVLYEYVRRAELTKNDLTLGELSEYVFGQMFHQLRVIPDVPLWTDDYSDVLRVMMLKEVQWVRKKLGLPTPVEE